MQQKHMETPYYLLDLAKVGHSLGLIRQALARYWPNSILSYSVKTNSWPFLLSFLARNEVWAEVVSEHEYDLALECGFSLGACVANGPAKSSGFIKKAIAHGALLNLDSLDEVRAAVADNLGKSFEFGVRVNATESDFPSQPSAGADSSRFGLSKRDGELAELAKILAAYPNARLTALHLHCNTRDRGVEGYEWLARFFAGIVREYSFSDVHILDIGGSFGHDFDCPEGEIPRWPTWDVYLSHIARVLKEEGFKEDDLRLVIEPGASLISGCVDYYSRIVGVKTYDGKVMFQLDGSRVHVDPLMTRVSFAGALRLERQSVGKRVASKVFVGSTCLEKDRLKCAEPMFANIGDMLVVRNTGGYTYGLSPLFFINTAPAVWVKDDQGCHMGCSHKTAKQFVEFLMP